MEQRIKTYKIRCVLAVLSLFVGFFGLIWSLFFWEERLVYLLGKYSRYICAISGFVSIIAGLALIPNCRIENKKSQKIEIGFKNERNNSKKQIAALTTICILIFCIPPSFVHSLFMYNATILITPKSGDVHEYIWISGNDDFVRKLNKNNPSGPEILSWDTGTSYPFGCEFRIEDGNEYMYIVDYKADILMKFNANNGTEVERWDISEYSRYGEGLTWNGSRWFIADRVDGQIYQVDPADPTVAERSFSYSGQDSCAGLAWDGSYLWAVDYATDKVYQMDIYGNTQTSWDFTPMNPRGITYDTTSGHLWIVNDYPEYLYEYSTNGTQINYWDVPGILPQGVAYAYVD